MFSDCVWNTVLLGKGTHVAFQRGGPASAAFAAAADCRGAGGEEKKWNGHRTRERIRRVLKYVYSVSQPIIYAGGRSRKLMLETGSSKFLGM